MKPSNRFQPPYQPHSNSTTDHPSNAPTNLCQPPAHTSPTPLQRWKPRARLLTASGPHFAAGYARAPLRSKTLRRKISTTSGYQFPAQT
jgi:hypothetical protein